jgi:hypothetical protein
VDAGDPRQFPKFCFQDPNPPDPDGRLRTQIRTTFTITPFGDDGIAREPIVVDFVKGWECDKPGRYHLRSR